MKQKQYEKEPNPYYPQCEHEDCYLQLNPITYSPIVNYCPEHEPIVIVPPPKEHKNKADKETSYAATLTAPPDYVHKRPLIEAAKMIMEHGLTNKPYEKATKWVLVLEHADTNAHVHIWYKTNSGRRIASKYFKRYHDLWTENEKDPGYKKLGNGFIGGYHQKARHNESYEAYLLKEGQIICSP